MKKRNLKILLPVAGVGLLVVSVLAFRDVKAGMGIGIASLVVFGAGVQGMKGKLGNTVYVMTKVGTYTKVRKKGANPQSPAQQLNRQQHALLMKLWSSPEVNRDAFNRYAAAHLVPNRMGKLIQISGINWFVKLNRLAQKANPDCALITLPTEKAVEFPVVNLTVSASLTPESVIVDVRHVQDWEAGMRLEILATMPISPGVSNGGKLYRSIGVYDPSLNQIFPQITQINAENTKKQIFPQITQINAENTKKQIFPQITQINAENTKKQIFPQITQINAENTKKQIFPQITQINAENTKTQIFPQITQINAEKKLFHPKTNRIDITDDYLAKLWTLEMGLQILVKARMIMPTGQASMFVTGNCIVKG